MTVPIELMRRVARRARQLKKRGLVWCFSWVAVRLRPDKYGKGGQSDRGWRSFYNNYYDKKVFRGASYGRQFVDLVCSEYKFRSVLDAGCGNGAVVREFLARGYDARGIEISDKILHDECPDMLRRGIVRQGSLTQLPFADSNFDLVFCSDVMEHIPAEQVDRAVAELVRVAKRHLFLTISLRPSSDNNKYHVTLRPREWWERKFTAHGVRVNEDLLAKLQKKKAGATVKEIIADGPAKRLIDEMKWFVDEPPYDLNGEYEPWFFVFAK